MKFKALLVAICLFIGIGLMSAVPAAASGADCNPQSGTYTRFFYSTNMSNHRVEIYSRGFDGTYADYCVLVYNTNDAYGVPVTQTVWMTPHATGWSGAPYDSGTFSYHAGPVKLYHRTWVDVKFEWINGSGAHTKIYSGCSPDPAIVCQFTP